MNADGSNQTKLTKNGWWDTFPSWSADGTKIAFVTDRDGGYAIYAMNVDGTNYIEGDWTNYAMGPAGERQALLTYGSGYDSYPSWGLVGQKIESQK